MRLENRLQYSDEHDTAYWDNLDEVRQVSGLLLRPAFGSLPSGKRYQPIRRHDIALRVAVLAAPSTFHDAVVGKIPTNANIIV